MNDILYSQARSFNLGIATELSVEAAFIYDDLAYAQHAFGEGYFYRSDEQMMIRFPFLSKNTIRRHVEKLVTAGWVSTKVEKVNGAPRLHYQIEKVLLPKMGKSMEIPKMGKSYIDKETIKETGSADAQALLIDLISLVNPKEKPTADRRRVLNGRLKDYSADEIRAAAVAFSHSEWHRQNKQMSIDNLLAPSKFGRWYEQSGAATESGDRYGYVGDKKIFTKDDDGKQYWGGELITPANQDRVLEEREAQHDGNN